MKKVRPFNLTFTYTWIKAPPFKGRVLGGYFRRRRGSLFGPGQSTTKAPPLKEGFGVVINIVGGAAADSRSGVMRVKEPQHSFTKGHKKKVRPFDLTLKRRLPTLPRENRSTIGVSELNFSVRNGKRWNLTAITT